VEDPKISRILELVEDNSSRLSELELRHAQHEDRLGDIYSFASQAKDVYHDVQKFVRVSGWLGKAMKWIGMVSAAAVVVHEFGARIWSFFSNGIRFH